MGLSSKSLSDQRVYAQDTEPVDRRDGVMWVDTSPTDGNDLYTWDVDQNDWVLAAPSNISIQDTAPSAATNGDGWIDTSLANPALKVYNGVEWQFPRGWNRIKTESWNTTGFHSIPLSGYDEYKIEFLGARQTYDSILSLQMRFNGVSTQDYHQNWNNGNSETNKTEFEVWGDTSYFYGRMKVHTDDRGLRVGFDTQQFGASQLVGATLRGVNSIDSIQLGMSNSSYSTDGEVEIYGRHQ